MRFNLRGLLAAFVVLSVALAILAATSSPVAIPLILFLNVALPAYLTAGVVYHGGGARAFCIGGLFPTCLGLVITIQWLSWVITERMYILQDPKQWLKYTDETETFWRLSALVLWGMTVLIGSLTALVHRGSPTTDVCETSRRDC